MQKNVSRLMVDGVLFIMALCGVYLQLMPNKWYNLTFYTVVSNLLVTGLWLVMVVCQLAGRTSWLHSAKFIRLKGALTMAILLTFFVYVGLLMPRSTAEQFWRWSNLLTHLIVPLATLAEWWIYDARGKYDMFDPVRWTVIPLLYMLYALLRGSLIQTPLTPTWKSSYPYFFMEIDKIGWGGFGLYFVVLLVIYIALGYGLYYLKRAKNSTV